MKQPGSVKEIDILCFSRRKILMSITCYVLQEVPKSHLGTLTFLTSSPLMFFYQVLLPHFTANGFQTPPSLRGLPWHPNLKEHPNSFSQHLWSLFLALFFFSEYLTQCYIFIHLIVCFTFTRIIGLELCDVHH